MPRVVDGDERRAHIADAVLRIAARDGLQAVSLRAVASESGLNIGSVRHYFDGQRDLMRFAMRSVIDRVAARLEARLTSMGSSPDGLLEFLSELLPLDGRRRAEVTVLVEFLMVARTDPDLDGLAREAVQGTLTLSRRVVTGMAGAGALTDGDRDVQAQQLAALLDGLAFRAVLQPEVTTSDDCVAALRTHLAALGRPCA